MIRIVSFTLAGLMLSACQQAQNRPLNITSHEVSAPEGNVCGEGDFIVTDSGKLRCAR